MSAKPIQAQAVLSEARDRMGALGVTVSDACLVEELLQVGLRLAQLLAMADEAAKQLAALGDTAHAAALRDRVAALGGRS